MKDKKKENKKSDFLSVRVAPHLKERLFRMAKEQERSLSWIVAKIIENYFKEHSSDDLEE